MKFAVLYVGSDETDVLMICDSESDAYEMVLSFAEEHLYELWYDENHNPEHNWEEIPPSEYYHMDDVAYDYFVVKAPYCPIFVEME